MKKHAIVKFSKPEPGEESLRFILLDDPAQAEEHAAKIRRDCAGGPGHGFTARADIQLIDSRYFIKPIQTVALSEICEACDEKGSE